MAKVKNPERDLAGYILKAAIDKYIATTIETGSHKTYMPFVRADIDKPIRLTDRAAIFRVSPVEAGSDMPKPALLVDLTEPEDEPGTKLLASISCAELIEPKDNSPERLDCFHVFKVKTPEAGCSLEEIYEKIAIAIAADCKASNDSDAQRHDTGLVFERFILSQAAGLAQKAESYKLLKRIGHVTEAVEAAAAEVRKSPNPDWNSARCLRFLKLLTEWEIAGVKNPPLLAFSSKGTPSAIASSIISGDSINSSVFCMFGKTGRKVQGVQQALHVLSKIEKGLSFKFFSRQHEMEQESFLVFSDGEEKKVDWDDFLWATEALSCIETNEALFELAKQLGFFIRNEFCPQPHIWESIAAVFAPNDLGARVYSGKTLASPLTAFKKLMNKNRLVPPDEIVGVLDFYGHRLRWGIRGVQCQGLKALHISVWLLNGVAASGDFLHKVAGGDDEKKEEIKLEIAARTALKFSSIRREASPKPFSYARLHWEDLNRFAGDPQRKEELQKALAASVIKELNATAEAVAVARKPVLEQQLPAEQNVAGATTAKREGSPLTVASYNRLLSGLLKCADNIDMSRPIEETFSRRITRGDVALVVKAECSVSEDSWGRSRQSFEVKTTVETPEILKKIEEETEKATINGRIGNEYRLEIRVHKICRIQQTSLKTMAGLDPESPESLLINNFTEEDLIDLTEQIKKDAENLRDQIAALSEETLEALRELYPVETMKFYLQQTASNGPDCR